jgi:hypothetical protein
MKRLLCGVVAMGLFVGGAGEVKADYIYTPIDVPGSGYTIALSINDAGQIVGQFGPGSFRNAPYHGFLFSGGGYMQLDLPGSVVGTAPAGINASGQIVGTYGLSGFLLGGGNYTLINVPSSPATWGNGINDSGKIVGGYTYYDYLNRWAPTSSAGAATRCSPGSLTGLLRGLTTPGRSC